jgi:hypothetical protein
VEAVTANGFGRSPRRRAWCAVIGLRFVSLRDGASIPCARPIARKERWPLRQHRPHRLRPYWAPAGVGASSRQLSSQRGYAGPQVCCSESAPDALSLTLLTVLTVLTVFSGHERIRITLLPARPSRLNALRPKKRLYATKWPPRARGFFDQPAPSLGIRLLLPSTLTRRRSAAPPRSRGCRCRDIMAATANER